MRTIEVYDIGTATWSGLEWSTVVSGMLVRMFEESGDPVIDGTGVFELNVVADAYQQTISGVGDIWTINIADPEPTPVPRREE